MELIDTSQPAVTKYVARDRVVISAGKRLKIETSPDGEEILNVEVPAGKTWAVQFNTEIFET